MMGSGSGEWRLWRLDRSHATPTTRHKRLCLWVEGVVAIITTGNWVLALGIMGVDICWELPVCIRDSHMPLRTGWGASPRLVLSRRSKARLPTRLLRANRRNRCTVVSHRASTRRIALLGGLRGILVGQISRYSAHVVLIWNLPEGLSTEDMPDLVA